jgi:hypothetical protein
MDKATKRRIEALHEGDGASLDVRARSMAFASARFPPRRCGPAPSARPAGGATRDQAIPRCRSLIHATSFNMTRNEEAFMYQIYNTNGNGAHVRSSPSSNSTLIKTMADGEDADVVCQVAGETVSDGTYSSAIWDRLSNGGYVSDLYVTTKAIGGFTPGIPRCS